MIEAARHKIDHADVHHRFACLGVSFVVFAVSPPSPDPSERSLDDPSFRQDNKSFDANRTKNRLKYFIEFRFELVG